jgi:hypothetical protein
MKERVLGMLTQLAKHLGAVTLALALPVIVAPIAPAAPQNANQAKPEGVTAEKVLSDFRNNLQKKAAEGDDVAKQNIHEFDSLSADQKSELGDYLLGEKQVNNPKEEDFEKDRSEKSVSRYSDGNFSWERRESVPQNSADELAQERRIWGTQTFNFLGIKIIEHKVTGSYSADGKPSQILSHDCAVARNYDPIAEVTTTKSSSYVFEDAASFSCTVRVKRGVPSPWGNVSWSTREGTHVLVGNGAGEVTRNGWQ